MIMRKLLLLLCALLGTVGAWAETYTITFDHRTGTFYKGGSVSTGWVNQWVSNEEGKPAVTITASANNINTDNGRMAPGSAATCTYSLSTESGYRVTGFSMNCPTFGAEVTVTPAGESAVVVATGGTLVVNSSASSFVYSGSNSGRIQASAGDSGTFTITVEEDTEAQSWLPSFGIGSTIVVTGDKAESVTAATNGADNDHWYLVTQVRNGESALYDNGTQLMRGTTDKTAVSFNGATVESSSAYLVRFISAGSEDLYHIQLGNGKYLVNLDANPNDGTAVNTTIDYRNKGTHAFYNSNGGSGSYFGWNLNSKTAKKVDNNGAGNALSYWGEGTASGTSGNSIWYVYPVTINTPASTVDVTYNLVVGGDIVNTKKVTVAANSEINIPAELTAGYASSYYNFNTSGTIGDEDCVITVTPALKDNTVVYPYTNISNNKSYYIYTNDKARGGLSTYTDSETTYLAASVKSGLSLSPKKFAIINYEENYYLYSVDDAKFVTFDGTADTKAALAATVTGTSDRITFTQTNNPLYEVKFDGNSTKIINSSNSTSYPYGLVVNNWGSNSGQWDDGCQYTINEADDFDPTDALAVLEAFFHPSYTVTYIVKDVNDNTIFTSESIATELGAHITSLPAKYQRDFCSYNTVDVTISETHTDIEFTATYNLPFTISTSYAGATWYYATIRGTKYLRADDDAKDSSGRYATNSTNEFTDAYKWAFFGNPYAFYVMNKNQGDGKYMAKDTQIVFSSLADPTADNNALWAVSSNSNGGFTLRNIAGGDTWYVNDAGNNGNLGFWDSSWGANDPGSNWAITEVNEALYNALIEELEAVDYGTALGQYTLSGDYASFAGNEATLIATIKSAYGDAGNYTDGITAIQGMINATVIVEPAKGTFLRMSSVQGAQAALKTADFGSRMTVTTTKDAQTIFFYSADSKLISFANGGVIKNVREIGTAGAEGDDVTFIEAVSGTTGKYSVKIYFNNNYNYLYSTGVDGSNADRNTLSDNFKNNNTWTLEEVTTLPVAISAAGYATLNAPVALTIPDGVTAYTGVISASGKYFDLTPLDGTIPANTPVILEGEAGTYNFAITTSAAFAGENDLSGTVAAQAVVAESIYTLQKINDVIGLYTYRPEVLAGFKAYLLKTSEIKGLTFRFGEDGVQSLQGKDGEVTVYDLTGRRVSQMVKGIYVVNGRKVLVK